MNSIRFLIKIKSFSFINLIGLSFSMTFLILIELYLTHEYNFDKSYKDINQIFILIDSSDQSTNVDFRLMDLMKDNFPDVTEGTIYSRVMTQLDYNENVIDVDAFVSVDNNFFDFFDLKFISGNSKLPFNGLDEGILSSSMAKKVFGNEDPLGKKVLINHSFTLTIVGVIQDIPKNSSIKGEIFVNSKNPKMQFSKQCFSLKEGENPADRCKIPFNVFIKLSKGCNISVLGEKVKLVLPKDIRFPTNLKIFPFIKIHLQDTFKTPGIENSNVKLLEILSFVSLIIIILAGINFTNLTSAEYQLRFKEIGIYKAFGASRSNLIFHYLNKAVLQNIIASIIAIFFAVMILPYFSNILHTELSLKEIGNFSSILFYFGLCATIGLFFGLYPAFLLSGLNPISMNESKIFVGKRKNIFQNVLNIFQYSIAIILIICSLVIFKQIEYVKNKDLGFDKKNLLRISLVGINPSRSEYFHNLNAFINDLNQLPEVEMISGTYSVPGEISGKTDSHPEIKVDSTFLKTFGIHVINGRELLMSDVNRFCLINKEALKLFDNYDYHGKKVGGLEIVGVVNDFHYSSLHLKIEPLIIKSVYGTSPNNLTLKLEDGNRDQLILKIRYLWKKYFSEFPILYNFYDEWFNSMYESEEDLAKLISLFAFLSIVICCMGIFGLGLINTTARTKEMGIRKVNGANSIQIYLLISKSSLIWILVAFIISCPIAWMIITHWMNQFSYKTQISWWIFIVAGILIFLISLLSISYINLRVSFKNPIEILKYE